MTPGHTPFNRKSQPKPVRVTLPLNQVWRAAANTIKLGRDPWPGQLSDHSHKAGTDCVIDTIAA